MRSIYDVMARLMDEALDERDCLHQQLDMANHASITWQAVANSRAKEIEKLQRQLNAKEELLMQYRAPVAAATVAEAEAKVDVIDARASVSGQSNGKSWMGAPTADDLSRQLTAAKAEIENLKGASHLFQQANATLVNRNNELLNKNVQLEERARKAEQRGHA
jgi:hypothetical protein